MKKIYLPLVFLFFCVSTVFAQVGIGTTLPDAQLDIRSSDQTNPSNTDGILVPKVDIFPTTNPATAQQGMLVYLTTTTIFLATTRQPGFYYWNDPTSDWIALTPAPTSDHDWYEESTTAAPDAITDDMFHTGNVAIGKTVANYPLEVETTTANKTITTFLNNSTNAVDKTGIDNTVTGTSDDIVYGVRNTISNSGTGVHYANYNAISGAGSNTQYGSFTDITNTGIGTHIGAEYNLAGNGTGARYGISTTISNATGADHYGIISRLNGGGAGTRWGTYNTLGGAGTGQQIANYNQLNGTGGADNYAVQNSMTGTGAGIQYGVYTSIFQNGGGPQFGSYNYLNTTNSVTTNSSIGTYNRITGASAGVQTGTQNSISSTGNATHYGVYSTLSGTGTGEKHGYNAYLDPAAGGTHYGFYASVLKPGATNFAGYFLGNVGIGTNGANTYTLPASRGTNGQIMQTNGTGVVSWQNPSTALNSYAWLTTGNSGTTAGTNFIGTTDGTDFVTKTAGSAAANERMRVTSAGRVIINNTSAFTSDVFSVYANNTTGVTASINNAVGLYAINGLSSGSGTGIFGDVYNAAGSSAGSGVWGNLDSVTTTGGSTSEGVWGTNSASVAAVNTLASGVRGDFSGTTVNGTSAGVVGVNAGTSGAAFGVYGQTASTGAYGVFGINTDTSANPTHGIQGQSAGNGLAAGIRGFNTAAAIGAGQSGFGVRGTVAVAPTGTGYTIGVRGDTTGASGTTYGLYGTAASATGAGLGAINSTANGTGILTAGNNAIATYLTAGSGIAANGNPVGVFGYAKTAASGIGVYGVGNNLPLTAPTNGAGVVGNGALYGVMGFATTTVNTNPNNNQAANGVNASAGGYFEVQAAGIPQTWSYVGVRETGGILRKIIGQGTVNTIVNDLEGKRVALSCPEAPENLFQDYGQGKLINGKAHIVIDPILAKNIAVNDKHPLRVFVQLEGDCEGVFVSNKTASGFDVTELKNGSSNVAFSYTIVANRADEVNPDGTIAKYSEERFAPAPGPQITKKMESIEENQSVRKPIKEDEPIAQVKTKAKPTKKQRN